MRGELVAIDLESTGLDPANDAVIEIGIVRMKEGIVLDEFSTFVNPGFPIPPQVSYITNIYPEDVVGAPTITEVLPQISAFVGIAPVIAHSVSLDMGFLRQRYGLLRENVLIDTYDLATLVLPSAQRYTLGGLAQQLGIVLKSAHRALNDARAAAELYWALWQKLLSLPHSLIEEILHASRGHDWITTTVLTHALRESTTASSDLNRLRSDGFHFPPLEQDSAPLIPLSAAQPLDVEAIVHDAGPDGALAATIPNYEHRLPQIEMMRAVAEAINAGRHLMIEAGTGTGKSLAYLLPAAQWATRNRERVVISTNTIALQEQLLDSDLPLIRRALNSNFRAALLKGRSNYLCPRRLAALRRRLPTSLIELRVMAKVLVWLLENTSGDKSQISLRGPNEHAVWARLSAQDENCTLSRCETSMNGTCPFYKARKLAETAHVLVVNHALLIADANAEHGVLPDYRYGIIDEAHQLEDAITSGMSIHVDQPLLQRRLADLGTTQTGLLGELLANLRGRIPEKDMKRVEMFVQAISEAIAAMSVHINRYFQSLLNVVREQTGDRQGDIAPMLRLDAKQRDRRSFDDVRTAWTTLAEFFEVIAAAMSRLTTALGKLSQYNVPNHDDFVSSAQAAARHLEELNALLRQFTLEPDTNTVYWAHIGQSDGRSDNLVIHAAPLHVGILTAQHLWHTKESVILTSATLRTQDNFDYIRERLSAEDAQGLEVGSPFDFRQSTLIYLPTDIPEPTDKQGYQRAVERGIIELASALNGRVLVLFTSYAQLRQTAQAIAPRLALGSIAVYDQSDGGSRQSLVEGFKTNEKAVLMGTRSFWEGIDIPGESLSALVIVRLPFAVPTDPVFAARSETYSDAFNDYAVPDAILRFRQGFGRLIRTRTDRGVVTVFDSRVITKKYGENFLAALPECTHQRGPLEGLAGAAKAWINPVGDSSSL